MFVGVSTKALLICGSQSKQCSEACVSSDDLSRAAHLLPVRLVW